VYSLSGWLSQITWVENGENSEEPAGKIEERLFVQLYDFPHLLY